jgi:hypothetical protein
VYTGQQAAALLFGGTAAEYGNLDELQHDQSGDDYAHGLV